MLILRMVSMQQVHGSGVFLVDHNDDGKIIKGCDALISNDPGVILSVRVADCLPISVVDKKNRSIGLIHAGWRGFDKVHGRYIRCCRLDRYPPSFERKIESYSIEKRYVTKDKKNLTKKTLQCHQRPRQ